MPQAQRTLPPSEEYVPTFFDVYGVGCKFSCTAGVTKISDGDEGMPRESWEYVSCLFLCWWLVQLELEFLCWPHGSSVGYDHDNWGGAPVVYELWEALGCKNVTMAPVSATPVQMVMGGDWCCARLTSGYRVMLSTCTAPMSQAAVLFQIFRWMCWFVSHHTNALVACQRTYDYCVPFAFCTHGTNSTGWGQEGHILLCLWRSAGFLWMQFLVGRQAARWWPPGILPEQRARYWFPLIFCWYKLSRRLCCSQRLPWVQHCQVPLPYLWFRGQYGHCWILPRPIRAVVCVSHDTWRQSAVWNLSMFCRRRLHVAIPCTPLGTCRLRWQSEMPFVGFVLP